MTTQPDPPFSGFEYPHDHWSKLPHALIDQFSIISTVAELKVLLYVLRHTWGFQDFDAGRRITLDEFCHGRKRSDGTRLDGGMSLSPHGVKAGVRAAVEHGFLIRESDGRDAARSSHVYRLSMRSGQAVKADGEEGYPAVPPSEDDEYPAVPLGVSRSAMRSGKETLKESDADVERNNLPSEAAPKTGLLLRDERLVGRDPDAQIPDRATAQPARPRAGGQPEGRLRSPAVRGGREAFDAWEANRFLQAWHAKHPAAPLADIIELGQTLEERIGMRPDWADRSEVGSWLSGLEKALRAAEGDAELVVDTALDMRDEGLAIPEPYSLVGMVRDAAARTRVHHNRGAEIRWLN